MCNRFPAGLAPMSLCALVAAALTACGGGEGAGGVGGFMSASTTGAGPGATEAAAGTTGPGPSAAEAPPGVAEAAPGVAEAAPAAPGAAALATGAAPGTPGTAALATGTGPGVPGDIPASAAPGSSEAPDTSALGTKSTSTQVGVRVASENQNFLVAGTMSVRYGAGSAWVTKQVTDKGSCTNDYFGKDPARGTVKACEVLVSSVSATDPKSVASTGVPTAEGGTFYVFGTTSVRYGANGKWLSKSVTGRAECTSAFFGNDPILGTVKACELVTAAATTPIAPTVATAGETSPTIATTTAAMSPVAAAGGTMVLASSTAGTGSGTTSLAPYIDKAKIPQAMEGWSTERVNGANVADASQNPVRSDIGSFREYCEFSHMSYDDPIVAPGLIGGHLHTFMGNTGTNSKSTATSIATSGNSTCAGGTLNRSSYWFPTVVDTADGTPLSPVGSLIYYKQGYHYVTSESIKAFPAGLRMVAGDAAASSWQGSGVNAYTCWKPDGSYSTHQNIPADCPTGSTLTIAIIFPQCWDGVNLDSPDHKSHMAYPVFGCPASHPVPLTNITMNINYRVTSPNGTSRWRLSSDNYDKSLPGGYSSHADWFNGWNPGTLATWTSRCITASMDCHAFLIGDGRILY